MFTQTDYYCCELCSYESLRGLKGAIQIGLKEQPAKIQNCSDSAMAGVAADAEALFKAKRFADSLPLFDEHIQKNPNDKVGFCNRAQVHIEMNNYEEAVKDAEQSLSLDPAYAKAYKRKADAFIGLGKRRVATEILLDASKLLRQMGASHELLTDPMIKLNKDLGGYIENLESNRSKAKDVCVCVPSACLSGKGNTCRRCKGLRYCSSDHLEAHQQVHSIMCKELKAIGDKKAEAIHAHRHGLGSC